MITVLTSFSRRGYDDYGRRFLQTFHKHWPTEVKLLIYHENQPELGGYDVIQDVEGCRSFLNRHKDDLVVQGRQRGETHRWKKECIEDGYNFRFDAYKFCRKVFAIEHAANLTKTGKLLWVDADVLTFDNIPLSFLDSMLPDHVCTSHLGRVNGYHSECGFVGYNLDHPMGLGFIKSFTDLYRYDKFFELPEWHDSWVYDWIRKKVGAPSFNISTEQAGHVFVTSPLGRYMDHLKGDRKTFGRSRFLEGSKVPHDHPYWRKPL